MRDLPLMCHAVDLDDYGSIWMDRCQIVLHSANSGPGMGGACHGHEEWVASEEAKFSCQQRDKGCIYAGHLIALGGV